MAKDKVVNVPNVGPVSFPASMGWDEIEKNVRLIAIQQGAEDVAAPKRTWGEAAKDIGLNLGQGIGSMLFQPIGTAAGYYPGADNFLTRAAEGLSYGQQQYQSDAQRANEMLAQNRINRAEKESGQLMAGLQAAKEYVTNPVLASKFVAEQLPQILPFMGVSRGAKALSGLAGLSEAMAGRVGIGAGIGTGAAMNASDVGNSTYQAVMGLDAKGLQEMQRDPEFQQYMTQTGDIGKAQQLYAENHARKAAGLAAGITLATAAIPGAQSVERFLAGKGARNLAAQEAEQLAKSGFLKGVGRGVLGESAQEIAEEGGGQYLQNIYTPGAEPMAGVGQAAGLGALGGALFGGVSGGIEGAAQKAEYNRRMALLDQFKQNVSSAVKESEVTPPAAPPAPVSPVSTPAAVQATAPVAPATIQQPSPVSVPVAAPIETAPPTETAAPVQTPPAVTAAPVETAPVATPTPVAQQQIAEPQDIATKPISEEEVMAQPLPNVEPVETPEPVVSPSERVFAAGPDGSAVGWDIQGSKPFSTMKAANAALDQGIESGTLDSSFRPVSVGKGKFYLSPMTPAEIKAVQIAQDEKASKDFAKNKPVPAHDYIASLGGVDPSLRSDTRIEGNKKAGKGWLFAGAKTGKGLNGDQIAEALYQGGYTPTELDGHEALDFVMKSVDDPQYRLGDVGKSAEEEMRQRMADAYTREQEAEETPEEVAARKAAEEDEFFKEERNGTQVELESADRVASLWDHGKVVWQDGPLALVRAFVPSALGNVHRLVYLPIKNGMSTFQGKDVEKEKPTANISQNDLDRLIQVKKDIEDADQLKHKTNPFIKFNENGLSFSQNVAEQIQNIATEWKKMFRLGENVYITTLDDIELNQDNFDGTFRSIIPYGGSGSRAGFMWTSRDTGDVVIAYDDSHPTSKIIETLSHEFGHLHEKEVFNKADQKTKDAIIAEYEEWLKKIKNPTTTQKQLIDSLRARKSSKLMIYPVSGDELATSMYQYESYWTSFSEWYADQTARWATTTAKPLTVVQKFFKRLGDAMRSFYSKLKNAKYLPNESFKQYMDSVTRDVNFIPDTSIKPLSTTGQYDFGFMLNSVSKHLTPQLSSNPVVASTEVKTAQQVNKMTTAPTTVATAEQWDSLVKNVPTIQGTVGKLKDFVSNMSDNQRTNFFKVLTMRQLADLGKDELPGMKDYMNIVNEMAGDRDTRIFKAGEIADKWSEMRRKDPVNYIKCSDVMHESTIARFDPSLHKDGAQLSFDNKKILDAYESMPEEWQNLYKEVRDYYAKRGREYQLLIESRIDQAVKDKKHALGIKLMLKQRFEQMMKQGPYFPLARFGNYSAYFEVNGEPHYYLFENVSDLNNFQRQNPTLKMKTGVKLNDLLSTKSGSGDTFVNEVFKQIDAMAEGQGGLDFDSRTAVDQLKDAIWQLNLLSKPEVSMSRNFIHRNNIKGYDNDALRAFSSNTFHASYQMAKLKFQGVLQSKMNEMQRMVSEMTRSGDPNAVKAGEYLNELSSRRDWIMNPADSNWLTEKASQFGFLYFLASPASALVNLSQNAVIAYPTLGARFGFGRAFEAMSNASKEFFKSGDRSKFMTHEGLFNITRSLKGNEKAAMERLIEIGTLTRTNTYDLAGLADKPSSEYNKISNTANKWISGLFHSAEVFNRSTTALAAYRLQVARLKTERNQGRNKMSDKDIHEQAIHVANDLTIESHFDYSASNKPPVMQGPTSRIILMYKQYAQHMTYLLANSTRLYMSYLKDKYKGTPMEQAAIDEAIEARRKLTGILGMTAILGGMTAMPLWWVVSGVMNAIMGDPDDPYDFDQEFTAALAENLNPTLAKAIMHGSPELLQGAGIAAPDLSGRISLNGLWFRDDGKNVDREEATRNFIVQMGGPYAGLAVNVAAAMKLINEGNTWRGMEKMLPSVIANGLKGIRYEFEGANTLRGDPLLGEVTHAEAALQALGFTPSRLARIYEVNSAQKGYEKDVTDRRNLILHKMYLAMMNGDDDAYDSIGDMIVNFNDKHPEYPITQDTIRRSIRGNQTKAAEAEHGVILNKKLSGKTRPMADILED